jgi:hypothetical protein
MRSFSPLGVVATANGRAVRRADPCVPHWTDSQTEQVNVQWSTSVNLRSDARHRVAPNDEMASGQLSQCKTQTTSARRTVGGMPLHVYPTAGAIRGETNRAIGMFPASRTGGAHPPTGAA